MDFLHVGKYDPNSSGGIEKVCKVIDECLVDYTTCSIYFGINENIIKKNLKIYKKLFSINTQPVSLKYFFSVFYNSFRAKIILLHYPNILSIIAILLVPFALRKTVVFWHSDVIGKGLLQFLVKPLSVLLFKRCKKVVALTSKHSLLSDYSNLFEKKFCIMPAVDLKVKINHKARRIKKNINYDKQLVCVGRFVPYKNFQFAIDVLKILPKNYKLIFIGDGPQKELISKKVMNFNLYQRVNFLGYVDDDQYDAILDSSDALLMLSNSNAEMFGLVQIEAMLKKIPVISCKIDESAVNYAVEKFGAGKICSLDAIEVANSIIEICNTNYDWNLIIPNIHKEFSKTKVKLVIESFSKCVG